MLRTPSKEGMDTASTDNAWDAKWQKETEEEEEVQEEVLGYACLSQKCFHLICNKLPSAMISFGWIMHLFLPK